MSYDAGILKNVYVHWFSLIKTNKLQMNNIQEHYIIYSIDFQLINEIDESDIISKSINKLIVLCKSNIFDSTIQKICLICFLCMGVFSVCTF